MKSTNLEVAKNTKYNIILHYEYTLLQICKKLNTLSIKNISKDTSILKTLKKNDALPIFDGFLPTIRTLHQATNIILLQTEKFISLAEKIEYTNQTD
jgi:hypothetical protein